jgi:hypothetical protein
MGLDCTATDVWGIFDENGEVMTRIKVKVPKLAQTTFNSQKGLEEVMDFFGCINSLTPKSILAGTKNPRSKGFWIAKHMHANIPTMMEPFPPPMAWFCCLCGRGLSRPSSKGFRKINKQQEKIFYFYCLSANYNNCSPAIGNDSQNSIHCCRWATIIRTN